MTNFPFIKSNKKFQKSNLVPTLVISNFKFESNFFCKIPTFELDFFRNYCRKQFYTK